MGHPKLPMAVQKLRCDSAINSEQAMSGPGRFRRPEPLLGVVTRPREYSLYTHRGMLQFVTGHSRKMQLPRERFNSREHRSSNLLTLPSRSLLSSPPALKFSVEACRFEEPRERSRLQATSYRAGNSNFLRSTYTLI